MIKKNIELKVLDSVTFIIHHNHMDKMCIIVVIAVLTVNHSSMHSQMCEQLLLSIAPNLFLCFKHQLPTGKCKRSRLRDLSMNRKIAKRFVDKLENLSISDYNGLKSPGFTCYLNSVLQVLFMTKDFRDAVKRSCSKTTIDSHLEDLFFSLERKAATTHAIIKFLGIADVHKQQDAAEYLEKVLSRTGEEASKIFQGKLHNKTTCLACNDENHSYNLFWLLPLPMEDVTEGLDSFFKAQTVSGDNQLYCTHCKKEQDSEIKCEITDAPGVVILMLKRFTFDARRRCYVKFLCDATVAETIRIGGCTYDLYAVINHFGTLTGGHYTAEIKSFETGFWYCFNDDIVKMLKKQFFGQGNNFFRSPSAYILLYKKVNEEPKLAPWSNVESQPAQPDDHHEKRHNKAKQRETTDRFAHMSFTYDWTPDRSGVYVGNTNELKQLQVRSKEQEAAQTRPPQSARKHKKGTQEPWRY